MLFFKALIVATLSLAATVAETQEECYQYTAGVYLQRFLKSDNTSLHLGLILFSPDGTALQTDSLAKKSDDVRFSDVSGFYDCKKFRGSQVRTLSPTGFLFQNRGGNITINLINSSMNCHGAIDDCTDNRVTCNQGRRQSQGYPLALPNEDSGVFEDPIPGTLDYRRFELLRLYAHPRVTNLPYDRCYQSLRGVVIYQVDDGNYFITAFTSSGYIFGVDSAQRRADGTFDHGTFFGK